MAGPQERRLAKAQSARPTAVRASADSWRTAADGLADVAAALRSAKGRIRESWSGSSADVAVAAFESLAASVDQHQETMRHAVSSLETAASGLETAKSDYAALPAVLPAPEAPDLSGQDDQQSLEEEIRYMRKVGAHRQSVDARETEAGAANARLENQLDEASDEMRLVAPEPQDRNRSGAGGDAAGGGGGAGQSGSGGSGYSSGSGGAHGGTLTSPYATGSGGTYVSGGSALGGGVAAAGLAAGHKPPRSPGLNGSATADGPVDGVVPGGDGPTTGALSGTAGGASGTSDWWRRRWCRRGSGRGRRCRGHPGRARRSQGRLVGSGGCSRGHRQDGRGPCRHLRGHRWVVGFPGRFRARVLGFRRSGLYRGCPDRVRHRREPECRGLTCRSSRRSHGRHRYDGPHGIGWIGQRLVRHAPRKPRRGRGPAWDRSDGCL